MLQVAPFLLKSYDSFKFTGSQGRMVVPVSPSQEMNYNYSFLLSFFFLILSMFVCSFFLSKSCIKISWACDQITHYIYIYKIFFSINQALLKRTKFKLYNPKHPSWSHISDDPASKATIYKTIPIVNKAPLSKLTSCLIYISHISNETWSIPKN